jgi:hypothetical protein
MKKNNLQIIKYFGWTTKKRSLIYNALILCPHLRMNKLQVTLGSTPCGV